MEEEGLFKANAVNKEEEEEGLFKANEVNRKVHPRRAPARLIDREARCDSVQNRRFGVQNRTRKGETASGTP